MSAQNVDPKFLYEDSQLDQFSYASENMKQFQ